MNKLHLVACIIYSIFNQTLYAEQLPVPKILFVDSYHQGFPASFKILSGVKQTFEGKNINLRLVEMDTKRNPNPDFIKSAALKTKSVIELFNPDILISCDDNAAKYLIEPYYKDSTFPIVFCGINWDASIYGFPYKNMTGTVEVTLISETLRHLKKYAKGSRIGFLGGDRLSERKNREYYQKRFKINFSKTYFVNSFEQWKRDFSKLQDEVDMLIITSHAGITDWNDSSARAFVEKHVKVPVATEHEWEMPYALVGVAKDYEEIGLWSGNAALKILSGIPPGKIPVSSNKKGKLFFNRTIAKKLGITKVPILAEIVQ